MTKIKIIGAALFSLLLAGPALSAGSGYRTNQAYDEHNGRLIQRMPAEGTSVTRPAYAPWPGPYDDGNYSRNHDDYMRLPPSAHGG
jgi:hypothetical protein